MRQKAFYNIKLFLGLILIIIGLVYAAPSVNSANADKQMAEPLITILCYHHVDLPRLSPYSVTSAQFKEQLDALQESGFTFISVKQLEEYCYQNKPLPERSALITFDDGNISAYTVAYPLLKKRNIPWVLFIYPSIIDYGHSKYCVNWQEVKTMADDGVVIGCHSLNHPFLTLPPRAVTTPDQYLNWLHTQLIDSKKYIEQKIGHAVKYFAVPFGAFDTVVYKNIKDSGYTLSFNVHGMNNGRGIDPDNVNRVIVLGTETLPAFMNKVLARPIRFASTYPVDLARITEAKPDVRFSIQDLDRYQKDTIELKVSGFKGIYLTHQNSVDEFDEQLSIHRKSFYIASVTAQDKQGNICRGNWLFKYDDVLPAFLPTANSR